MSEKTKEILAYLFCTVIIIGAIFIFIKGDDNSNSSVKQEVNNVSIVEGKQIISINAKGGYTPQVTVAKSGIPTVIKVDTKGTFDCSSSIVIPALGYQSNLPPSGETLIDVPPQSAGTTLLGLCSMGMYSFSINFN